MNTKNNLRYKMSNEKIEKAFLSLIKNNNYENITISQICKLANIHRSTFYLHYDDINDLIIKIESKFAKNMLDIFNYGTRQNNDAIIDMFNFVKENKLFYKAFLNIPYTTFAESNTQNQCLQHLNYHNNISYIYRARFFGDGIKALCKLWLDRDCKESPEFMANLLIQEYNNR